MRIECQHRAIQPAIAWCLQTISHLTHLWIIEFYSAATFIELKSKRTDVGYTYSHTHTPISLHRKETFSFTHWPVASDSCLSPLNPPTDRLFHWNLNCSTILLNAKTVMFRNGYGHCVCLIAGPSRLISLRSMNNKIFVRMTRWGNQNVWNSLNTRHDFTLFPIELNMVEETKSESN